MNGGNFVGSQENCPSVVQSEKLHTCSGMQSYIYRVVKLVGEFFYMSNFFMVDICAQMLRERLRAFQP